VKARRAGPRWPARRFYLEPMRGPIDGNRASARAMTDLPRDLQRERDRRGDRRDNRRAPFILRAARSPKYTLRHAGTKKRPRHAAARSRSRPIKYVTRDTMRRHDRATVACLSPPPSPPLLFLLGGRDALAYSAPTGGSSRAERERTARTRIDLSSGRCINSFSALPSNARNQLLWSTRANAVGDIARFPRDASPSRSTFSLALLLSFSHLFSFSRFLSSFSTLPNDGRKLRRNFIINFCYQSSRTHLATDAAINLKGIINGNFSKTSGEVFARGPGSLSVRFVREGIPVKRDIVVRLERCVENVKPVGGHRRIADSFDGSILCA